jgi:hypothetical protein
MTNEEFAAKAKKEEFDRCYAAYEKAKKEFAETHKPAVCMNGACKREIQPGDTVIVVPIRDEIFCSAECLADYYGGYELEFDADDDDYESWFEKKELGE